MIKREYNLERLMKDIWDKRYVVIIILVVSAVIGSGLGVFVSKKEQKKYQQILNAVAESPTEEEDIYVTELRNYEDSLEACKQALILAEEQRDNLQAYIDGSILMKINPDDVKTVSVSYVISESGNVGNINNAYIAYVNDGGLKNENADTKDVEIEAWREIVNVYQSGNNLVVTVSHYDMNKANQIMDIIQTKIANQKNAIAKTQGEFVITEVQRTQYSRIDNNIANTQNNNINNLKGYILSVSDCNYKVNSALTALDNYKEKNEMNKPPSVERGQKKTIFIFAVLGIVGGFMLIIVSDVIIVMLSPNIYSSRDLIMAGLEVWNVYDVKNKRYDVDLDIMRSNIVKLIEKNKFKNVCVLGINEDNDIQLVKNNIIDCLKNQIEVMDNIDDGELALIVIKVKKCRYEHLEKLESVNYFFSDVKNVYIVIE